MVGIQGEFWAGAVLVSLPGIEGYSPEVSQVGMNSCESYADAALVGLLDPWRTCWGVGMGWEATLVISGAGVCPLNLLLSALSVGVRHIKNGAHQHFWSWREF